MSERIDSPIDDTKTPGEGAVDIRALGAAIWRHRLRLAALALTAGALVFAYTSTITPLYRSEARVLIESPDSTFTRPGNAGERPAIDEQAVQNQVQLILSRDLGIEVVRKLDLINNREFNPSGTTPSLPKRILGLIGLGGGDLMAGAEERTLTAYFDRLAVYNLQGSRVIAIEFSSADPDLAATVANAVADTYLTAQQSAKQSTTRQASTWLEGEIDSLRGRVSEAEARVEEYRSRLGLFSGSNNTALTTQQLGELNTQLATARAQQAEAQAKASLIADVLKNNRPIESLDIVNAELIRRLLEQRVTLQAQRASELRTLLPGHPRIKELSAQISDLDQQIRLESERIGRAYENDAKVANARVDSLVSSIETQKKAVSLANEQEVQLRALEREAKAQRDLLEQFLGRFREADARESLAALPPDARIISRAAASMSPYFPKVVPMVIIAVAATLFVGIGVILAIELLRATAPRSRAMAGDIAVEAPGISGAVPVFGSLGVSTPAQPASAPVPTSVPEAPDGIEVADARILEDLAIHLARAPSAESAPRILVTGVSDAIEPSGVALALARSLAARGKKPIVLDIGGGGAAIEDLLDDAELAGVSDLLAGGATFTQAIHRDPMSGVHLIPYGTSEPGGELMGKLSIIMDALGYTYDFVVFSCNAKAFSVHEDILYGIAGAAILVAAGSASDPATVAAHNRFVSKGVEDVVVLMVRPGGSGQDSSRVRARRDVA